MEWSREGGASAAAKGWRGRRRRTAPGWSRASDSNLTPESCLCGSDHPSDPYFSPPLVISPLIVSYVIPPPITCPRGLSSELPSLLHKCYIEVTCYLTLLVWRVIERLLCLGFILFCYCFSSFPLPSLSFPSLPLPSPPSHVSCNLSKVSAASDCP